MRRRYSSIIRGHKVVISGLRAPAEVAAIFRVHPKARLIFVEARFEIRLDRALRRARPGHVLTADDLRALDRLHETMGLNAIAAHAKATVVLNEATLSPYREALTAAMLPG